MTTYVTSPSKIEEKTSFHSTEQTRALIATMITTNRTTTLHNTPLVLKNLEFGY
jgi:hypothetical protein